MRLRPILLLCSLSLLACDKKDDASDEAKPAEGKSETEAKEKSETKADSKAGESSEKESGSEEPETQIAGSCPTQLGGALEADLVIGKTCSVPVKSTIRVEGTTLTIEGGATLAFADGAELSVGYGKTGKLIVKGTAEAPVTFESAGDKAPGVWKGVRLYGKAARSSLSGLVIEHAGEKRKGALYVEAEDVSIVDSTVRNVKEAGLVATKTASFSKLERNSFSETESVAMRMPAPVVGGIGEGNKFEDGSRVHVLAGTVEESVFWRALTVPYLVVGDVKINGKEGVRAEVKIEPGAAFQFDGDGRITVGYAAEGSLVAKGTPEKPISFSGSTRQEAGAWRGLAVYSKGELELENVSIAHAGKRDNEGAVFVDNGARASVRAVKFESNAVGVSVRGRDSQLTALDSLSFKTTPIAINLPARLLGVLGSSNQYEGDPRIVVAAGAVETDAKWLPQPGAKIELDGKISIDKATVEIAAGFSATVKDGVGIDVGYRDNGTLKVSGTAAAPVVLAGTRETAGAWKTLTFHSKARAIDLQHLKLKHAGDPAIWFKKGADGKVSEVACDTCSGETFKLDEPAKVQGVN